MRELGGEEEEAKLGGDDYRDRSTSSTLSIILQ